MSGRSSKGLASTARLAAWLSHGWYYLALAAVFVLGWRWPQLGAPIDTATPYLVAFAFFLNGFTLSTTALVGNLRQGWLLIAAMLITFILPAALVFILRKLLPGGDTPLAIGFQLLAVVPTTLVSAVVLTRVANGNGALALYITVLANLLAIVLVPPLMQATLGRAGAQLPIAPITLKLVYTVLLPTLGGQFVRRVARGWAIRHVRLLGVIAQITVLLFIISGLAGLPGDTLSPMLLARVIAGAVLLHLTLLALADLGGRLLRIDTPSRFALVLSTSQKSLVAAMLLWRLLLKPLGADFALATLPLLIYYVAELVIDSTLAQWWGHRNPLTTIENTSELPIEAQ